MPKICVSTPWLSPYPRDLAAPAAVFRATGGHLLTEGLSMHRPEAWGRLGGGATWRSPSSVAKSGARIALGEDIQPKTGLRDPQLGKPGESETGTPTDPQLLISLGRSPRSPTPRATQA